MSRPADATKRLLRRSVLAIAARLPAPAHQPSPQPRILLVRPDHLGDLLFMTPALHALRQALPGAHLACLAGPWAAPILAANPDLDELLTCDFPWFNRRPSPGPWQPYALLRAEARRLTTMRFDVALVLRFDFWWGAALARLAGIPRRIGYAVPDVQPFLTEAVPYTPGLHEVEQNWRLAAALAPELRDLAPGPLRFTITPEDAAWAAQVVPAGAIAIHPGAGAAVKLWSLDGWAAVGQALAERHQSPLVLTGGPGEIGLVDSLAARLSVPAVSLAGQTTLGRLAALYARCRLVLGPDSGPLHLAVAAGAPTVHLFGPIDPVLFGPWGDPERHLVVQARYFDLPCHNMPCNRLDYTPSELSLHPCMQTITAEQVLAAAEEALRRG